MAEAKRDQNHITTAMGYDETNGTTECFIVDPTTNYLLVEFQPWEDYVGTPMTSPTKRDQNHVPASMGIDNDTNENLSTLAVNKSTNLLWVNNI